MATMLKRLEFKQRYPSYSQGLFILSTEKRLPKEQLEINIGRELSKALCDVKKESRAEQVTSILEQVLYTHSTANLTHVEILFSPSLKVDIIRVLQSQCRNRKICFCWPGIFQEGKLIYSTPEQPEYYECDLQFLQDTYIIFD